MTKKYFSPNISGKGRWLRAVTALILFIGAGFAFSHSFILALALAIPGVFVLFEALRGWCVLRACGIRTRY